MGRSAIPAMVPWSPKIDLRQPGDEHGVRRGPVIGVSKVEASIGIRRLETAFFRRNYQVVSGVTLGRSIGYGCEGPKTICHCRVALPCGYARRPSRPGTERVSD